MECSVCLFCGQSYVKKSIREKYCSYQCVRKFHNKKQVERRKTDPEFAEKHRISENKRKKNKYYTDPVFRAKRLRRPGAKHLQCARLDKLRKYKYANRQGYILIWNPEHPNSHRSGRIMEHIFVMSEYLKRPLEKDERVHHKNGVRDDNRIENLELWTISHPYGQRVSDKIQWAKEILEKYGHEDIIK